MVAGFVRVGERDSEVSEEEAPPLCRTAYNPRLTGTREWRWSGLKLKGDEGITGVWGITNKFALEK